MAINTVFSVQALAPGQMVADRKLEMRKSTAQELLRRAFAKCGLVPHFSWSAEDGLVLHVSLSENFQRFLFAVGGSSDPITIADAEVRRVSAELQAFAGRGLVRFADVEALESAVPGGAKYIREFAPSRDLDCIAIPIRYADGEPAFQLFHELPRMYLQEVPVQILFATKSVSSRSAKIRICRIDGSKASVRATLYWVGADSGQSRQVADKLYEGMHLNSTFEARVFGAPNPSGTVTRYDLVNPEDLSRPGGTNSEPYGR